MRKFNPANTYFVFFTLLRHGHLAAEPSRSAFVFYLLSFADLDEYPHRAALKAAFSPAGGNLDRCVESVNLARAKLLEKADYRYAARRATKWLGISKNKEIVECVEE